MAVAKAIKNKNTKRYKPTSESVASKASAGRSLLLALGIGEPKSFSAEINTASQVYEETEVNSDE